MMLTVSCSRKMNGAHQSAYKQAELSKNSNFDLKQAKAIIGTNHKHKAVRDKQAKSYQEETAKQLETLNKKKTEHPLSKKHKGGGEFCFY